MELKKSQPRLRLKTSLSTARVNRTANPINMAGNDYEYGHSSRRSKKGKTYTTHESSTYLNDNSYSSSSRATSHGYSTAATSSNSSNWRWNCCNCGTGNLSYNFDVACTSCFHRRDGTCNIWATGK
ncbi:hypothetical protein HD806DRAFT_384363 [Xylariaceae sp. AK1471]|nr:hypothetical protein HD806DRAFT_384363 [Xylariaceae sp. AK1471]